MHKSRALAIGPDRKRHGGNDRACIEQNIGADGGKARALIRERTPISQENGDVIIGSQFRVAARAGAKQNDALNTLTLYFGYGGTEAGQHGIGGQFFRHDV
jgi:hypothetical protein